MPTTRGGVSYTNTVEQQGRSGRFSARFPREKAKKGKRKRKDKTDEEPPSSPGEESGYEADTTTRISIGVTTRGDFRKITCLTFGRHRKSLYRDFFFCGKCDDWERDSPLLMKKANRNSQAYKCQATHTSHVFPTHAVKTCWCPSARVYEEEKEEDCSNGAKSLAQQSSSESDKDQDEVFRDMDDEDEGEGEDEEEGVSDRENEEQDNSDTTLQEKVHLLEQQVHDLENELQSSFKSNHALKRRLARLKMKNINIIETNDFEEHLKNSIIATVSRFGNRKPSSKIIAKSIANVAFTIFEGVAHSSLIDIAKQWLRTNVYSSWRIARLMDINGGALNLAGIELLRSLETNNVKYVRGSLLPSSASIRREFATIEAMGAIQAPFDLLPHPTGESIKFDYQKVLSLLIKAYGMHEQGLTRSLRFAQSIDGSNLTKHITHVMAGIKINDKSAVCPLTGVPLFSGDLIKVQSRTTCFPLQINLGKETDKMYDLFEPMFNFFANVQEHGLEGYQPLTISVECDLSATWKGLKRGGGAKVHTYPCHCCGILSDDLHHPTSGERCHRWCEALHRDKEGWRCYHHSIVTDETLEAMAEEVSELEESLANILDKIKLTRLTIEDPNTCGPFSKTHPTSIWFEATNMAAKRAYSNLLDSESELRGMTVVGNLSLRRDTLRQQLVKEWTLRTLSTEVQACARSERALFLLMQAIPCVLHMEMRVGLKLLTMLLLEGLSEAAAGSLTFPDARTVNQTVRAYVNVIETTINERVLGEEWNPSQWKCPYDEKEKKLGPLSMENTKIRKVIDKLELLIEVSVTNQDRKEKWLRCIPKYRLAMELARQKSDLSNEDVSNFQRAVDEFFQDWVELHGLAGMTNYIHMMGSGHIAEYMFKWKNLYVHSQQGWEAFNSLLKTFFFRRTGRGGGRGLKSKLKPIARWLQRRLLWLCGMTGEDLEAFRLMLKEQEEADGEEQEEQDEQDEQGRAYQEQQEEDEQADEIAEMLLGLGQYNI